MAKASSQVCMPMPSPNKDITLRLYAIVRKDLQMNTGKAASQCGHAFVNTFIESQKLRPKLTELYHAEGLGTKVCLSANNLQELLVAFTHAKKLNLPCSIIEDSGHVMPPFFDGSPVITAIGIGPCLREEIECVTKYLKLL